MKKSIFNWITLLCSIAAAVALSSCKTAEQQPKPKSEVESNISYAWLGFPQPCPTPDDAKVLVEKWVPKVIKPGEKFDINIKMTNRADYDISQTSLLQELPDKMKISSVTPSPSEKDGNIIKWRINNLNKGQVRDFKVSGSIEGTGSVRYTGSAILNFETKQLGSGKSIVEVIAPNLELATQAPSISIVEQKIPLSLTFRNSGTAPVKNVRMFYTLPKGMLTYKGKSELQFDIGDLAPSQAVNKAVELKGVQTGNYNLRFNAVASNNLEAKGQVGIRIIKPSLSLVLSAPRKRFVGNMITYKVTIKNTGDAPAENSIVELSFPDGTSLASINNNGVRNGSKITWDVGIIHPNETKVVSAKVVANRIMTARASATAEATAAEKLEVAKTTDVAGIAGLLCNLDDTHDPVPVGETEIYELNVRNQGSLPATKINVKCYLEDNMEYIKSSGASKGTLSGDILTFEPLPALEPQAEAKWTIIVKAVKPGDARFKAEVISDQLTRPVTLIEPTNFYE